VRETHAQHAEEMQQEIDAQRKAGVALSEAHAERIGALQREIETLREELSRTLGDIEKERSDEARDIVG
jgi:HAMP domain-containing protein